MQHGISVSCNVIAVLLLCSAMVAAADTTEQSPLQISHAWVQLAPPAAQVNAAYMQLINHSDKTVELRRVSADCCAQVMLHESQPVGDKVTMVHLSHLTIAPHSQRKLAPGGLHLMLLQPRTDLREADQVKLEFYFADGRQQSLTLSVSGAIIDEHHGH